MQVRGCEWEIRAVRCFGGLRFTLWVGRPREKGLRRVKEVLVNLFFCLSRAMPVWWRGRAELFGEDAQNCLAAGVPPFLLVTKISSPSKITTVSSHSFKALGRYSDICGRIEDYPSKACGLPPGLAGREKKDCGRDKGTLKDSNTIRSHFVYDTQSEGRCAPKHSA